MLIGFMACCIFWHFQPYWLGTIASIDTTIVGTNKIPDCIYIWVISLLHKYFNGLTMQGFDYVLKLFFDASWEIEHSDCFWILMNVSEASRLYMCFLCSSHKHCLQHNSYTTYKYEIKTITLITSLNYEIIRMYK